MINRVYILLGANLGSPIKQIESACHMLEKKIGRIIAESSLYKSEAWGLEDQPIFYNKVLAIDTLLNPIECLQQSQEIELQLGRIREIKWGARVIDIDLLYFNSDIIETDTLILPHPYIHLRNFTLSPLTEIAPDYIHPMFNKSNKQLLLDSIDKLQVERL